MGSVQELSLLDADGYVVDVWLVFRNIEGPRWPLWRFLKDGFKHVEVWRLDRGAWARFDPCLQVGVLEVHLVPPWEAIDRSLAPTFLRVRHVVRTNRTRVPFHIGPLTCVDGTKTVLGMWAPFTLTPYQLYRRLTKR